MAEAKKLAGKVALVTGSSRGIGAAIAKRLAADGAKVVVNYSSDDADAKAVVAAIEKLGSEAVAVQCDVGDPKAIPGLFAAAKKSFGGLDIFVNNAGVMIRKPIEEVTVEEIDTQFDVNVRGLLLCTVEALKLLPKGGKILFVSSTITRLAIPGSSVYSATKGAIDLITQVLAMELGPKGITVNAISPGATDTDMNADMTSNEKKQTLAMTALGRLGTAEDVADAAAFLVSEDAHWVTGEKLAASGGLRG
jgi:3-oxoacyl-[acyl-carrier protein] reductase